MSLLGRKKDASTEPSPSEAAESTTSETGHPSPRTTAPKGRPTPKRDAARRRGPTAPAPKTSAEARRRRKELRGPKLSREERREEKATQRQRMADRREKMMAGEEDYLLPRDQGPVRRYVRNVVDSRRNLLGVSMPAAFGVILVMFSVPVPAVQIWISPAVMLIFVIMLIDGFFLGRKVTKMVDEKFPKNTESGWKLGFYAVGRAATMRRMRAPRPQVERGTKVN